MQIHEIHVRINEIFSNLLLQESTWVFHELASLDGHNKILK